MPGQVFAGLSTWGLIMALRLLLGKAMVGMVSKAAVGDAAMREALGKNLKKVRKPIASIQKF
ncbi:MAG TPA: hypothetical protein VEL68_14830 [Thermodesulfobacteriota bacterium]|nr:hypothetical protein [Thermodesulfobacteriota bacterium]